MKKSVLYFISALFLLSLPSSADDSLTIKDIWARTGDAGRNSAVYFEATNNSNEDDEILGAKTSISNTTEIHKTVVENGISQMVHIHRLVLPAKNTVIFKPKGLHIMLMGLKQDLKHGDHFDLELIFKHSGSKLYRVIVR